MKKLFLLLAVSLNFCLAEEAYFPPKNLDLGLIAPSQLDAEMKPEYDPLLDKIFPIGWSKSGNFAYITEPADEACGCYFFTISIIDKEGKTLWEWKNTDNAQPPDTGSVAEVWKEKQELFVNKLQEYGIKQEQEFNYQKSQYSYNFAVKDLELNFKTQMADSKMFAFEIVKNRELLLKKGDTEQKIFSHTTEDEYSGILSEELVGLISNSSNQALVIISATNRGYEGPPNVVHFYFVNLPLNPLTTN